MMTYENFLNKIIDDGIDAAKADYEHKPFHRDGAIAGFEACRGKTPDQLLILLLDSRKKAGEEYFREDRDINEYWEMKCFELEIEWVCNCVSAMLMNENVPVIVNPTARGVLKAAEVLGVKGVEENTN